MSFADELEKTDCFYCGRSLDKCVCDNEDKTVNNLMSDNK